MALGRKKKEEVPEEEKIPLLVPAYAARGAKLREKTKQIVREHLEKVHRSGGLKNVKVGSSFVQLGMQRTYLDAIPDPDFTIDSIFLSGGQIVTVWTVRGRQQGELLGIPPTGEEVTIKGITVTSVREEIIRQEFTYFELPELTRRAMALVDQG